MKQINCLIVFIFIQLFSFLPIYAQETDCAVLHIYRPNKFSNSLVNITVYVNDQKVYALPNNSGIQLNLPEAGTYNVSVIMGVRGEAYRERTTKVIKVQCESPNYIKINAGSLMAEGVLGIKETGIGQNEMSGIPAHKVYQKDFGKGEEIAATRNETPSSQPNSQPKPIVTEPVSKRSTTTAANHNNSDPNLKVGTSYALIIGINEYQDHSINNLDQPIADAEKLYQVLINKYTFDQKNIRFLKNPSKNDITQMLDFYYEKLNGSDNLLIFYAGHGYWDEKFQQGYWLATDAQQNNRGTWLSNGTIRDYLRAIPTKHSLLVTDACFGGGIFKSRAAFSNSSIAINQLYKFPSRKAMTSGAMSEVPDKSVFIQYLVKRLEQNTEKYLSSEQLFASFKIAVINNSANGQVPQFGEVKETGDEGGDFIFIKR